MPLPLIFRRSLCPRPMAGFRWSHLKRLAWILPAALVFCDALNSTLQAGNPPSNPPKGGSAPASLPNSGPVPQPLIPGQSYVAPQQPPVLGANPAVRRSLRIQVPTRLKIVKQGDVLQMSIDPTSMTPAEITLGLNMLLGLKNEYRWRFAGDTRVQGTNIAYSGGGSPESVDFGVGTSQQKYVPGKKVVIELVVSVFETDIPPGIFWAPQSGQYQVLWTGTLSQPVE